jgi:uncharacterized protein (DUF58 family)
MSLRRNAMLLILLTGLFAIVGIWSGSPESWWALPAALLLSGLAYEVAILSRQVVDLRVQAPEYWPLGQSQPARFEFRQHSRGRLFIQAALSAPDEFAAPSRVETLQLAAGDVTVITMGATARRLGKYTWPTPALRIGGALGLAWWPRTVSAQCQITVVPDVTFRAEPHRGEYGGGARAMRLVGSGAEVLQLRDYRKGDPLRTIDWKATARSGRLISRDFTEDQHLEVIVAVDAGRASALGAGEVDRLSLYVNVAARLAQRASYLGDAVGLVVFAAQPLATLAPARGDAAIARICDLLIECRSQPSESNPVLAAARIRAIAQRRSLVLILTDLEDASAGEQLARAVRLLTPKHLPFIGGFRSARIEALPGETAQQPLGAYRALAATEYMSSLERNVLALRALGAEALTARPADLDAAVIDAYTRLRERRRI